MYILMYARAQQTTQEKKSNNSFLLNKLTEDTQCVNTGWLNGNKYLKMLLSKYPFVALSLSK